jgi:hypothetical protein
MSSSGLARLGGLAAVMADLLLLTTDIIDVYNIDAYRTAELNREYLTTGTHAFQSALRLVAFGLLLPLGLVGALRPPVGGHGTLGACGARGSLRRHGAGVGLRVGRHCPRPGVGDLRPPVHRGRPSPRALALVRRFRRGLGFVRDSLVGGHVYPKPAAALLIVGAVIGTVVSLTLLPLPLGGLPFLAAVAWLGYTLFAGWDTSGSGQPSRVNRPS